jgi:signal peptidase I
VLLVLALGVFVRCSVADLGRVVGGSMRPALRDGDRILTNKLAYGLRLPFTHIWPLRWSGPRRGEVVVLSSPVDGRRLVKRVVAVPGEPVGDGSLAGPTSIVPSGHYFVRGDDADSLDSRAFGCVPRERILGRVAGIALPFGQRRQRRANSRAKVQTS